MEEGFFFWGGGLAVPDLSQPRPDNHELIHEYMTVLNSLSLHLQSLELLACGMVPPTHNGQVFSYKLT